MADAVAPRDYAKIAAGYAKTVDAGKLPACKWLRLAVKRHLGDLAKAKAKGFPFVFDVDKGARVCRFLERLSHVKGMWAARGERLHLEPWQVWLTMCIFGWTWRESGLRRFRRVFLLIPRKNGKSLLAAGWGLYMLCADKEAGAEVYSGASTEKQAWEVFRPMRQMTLKNPQLMAFFGIEANAKHLHITANGSRAEPIIGNPGDGASPSCAIHDEYHEHETDAQVDAMLTGMGAREQPLQIIVTTAGANIAGPCYAAQLDAQAVLEAVTENDELFACIWTIDPGDKWNDPAALAKANPNFDISVSRQFLLARLADALTSPRKAGIFQTKHLNVWVQSRAPFFDALKWRQLARPGLSLADFKARPAVITLDLASKIDVAAMCIMLRTTPEEFAKTGKRFICFMRYYLPEDTVDEPQNELYRNFESAGALTVTDGGIIDIGLIRDDIEDLAGFLDVEQVGIDPWHAQQLVVELEAEGLPVVEYRQTVLTMSAPMKELDALIRTGLIEHEGDPCTLWMLSNVVAKVDAKDNVYPRKERPENKIDGPVAEIMAVGLLTNGSGPTKSVYEERGLLEIEA
jgi:phage terminase large subunit-like protein